MMKRISQLSALLIFLPSSCVWAGDSDKGIKVGKAIMRPSVSIAEKHNDNIYTQQTPRRSDYITVFTPALVVETVDTPHKLRLRTDVTRNWYGHHSTDNTTDFSAGADGRYNFDGNMYWDLGGGYRHLHSARGDNQADPTDRAAKPIPYDEYKANTSIYNRFGKFTMQPRLGVTDYEYKDVPRIDGSILQESARNRAGYIYGGELGYDLPKNFKIFTDLEGTTQDYRRKGAANRDSHGGSYLVGVQYRPNTNVLARLGGGQMHRDWRHKDVYKNINTWNSVARLDWTYKKNSKFTTSLRRSIDEVTDTGASAAIRTEVSAAVLHELYEQVLGKIGGRYARFARKGGRGAADGIHDRRDNLYEGTLGLIYKLNARVALTADYTYTKNKSNASSPSANTKRNVVMVGMKFGYFDIY